MQQLLHQEKEHVGHVSSCGTYGAEWGSSSSDGAGASQVAWRERTGSDWPQFSLLWREASDTTKGSVQDK